MRIENNMIMVDTLEELDKAVDTCNNCGGCDKCPYVDYCLDRGLIWGILDYSCGTPNELRQYIKEGLGV